MKNNLKLFSVLSAALAVALFTSGAALAFSAPDLQANCRRIENGLASYCDPVTSIQADENLIKLIPNTGSAPVMPATSLRMINELAFMPAEENLIKLIPSTGSAPVMLATSLRMINELAFMPAEENLIKLIPATGFMPAMPATSLRAVNENVFALPAAYYFGAR